LIGARNPAGLPAPSVQSVAALAYRLIEGPVRLEPLQVLASRTVDWDGWRATFFILGASHAVTLEREGRQLVELLTCVPPIAAVEPLLEAPGALSAERSAETSDLRAHVRLQPFLLRDGAGLSGRFGPQAHLALRFAASGTRPSADTEIGWDLIPGVLCVETVHTYPEEGRGVRTHTRFERCSR
jgi:hypothetical protein